MLLSVSILCFYIFNMCTVEGCEYMVSTLDVLLFTVVCLVIFAMLINPFIIFLSIWILLMVIMWS